MDFYDREISDADMEMILEEFNEGRVADILGYIRDNIVNRDPSLPPCEYHEIMGDCQWFEGLSAISDTVFSVDLGS